MPSVREAHRYPDRDRGVFADSQYEQGQKFLSDTVMFSPEKLTAMSIYQAFLNLSKYDQNWYKGLTHTGELPAVYPPGEQAPKKEPTKQPKKASKKGSRKETKYSNEELNEGPSTQSKETRRAETKLDQYAIAIEQDNIQWISPTKKVERIPFLKTRPERAQEGALVVAIFHHNAYKIRDEDNIHDVYAIFRFATNFNHSCIANVQQDWDNSVGRLNFYAKRDIEAGEELCIDYVPLSKGGEEMREKLKELYNFDCLCLACKEGVVVSTE